MSNTKSTAKVDHVSLADIARSLKMSPKAARRKARTSQPICDYAIDQKGWKFPKAQRAKVASLLKAS